ncbi:hypothetical protein B0J18DRAFT_441326 [Chaetomium sp. MPI-SDFR-AT-0129]|nr:hypothetical protein B0J18DRAFT_441326 [Chaetomium sp. MPI-SDFR-AT-0129]
MRYHMLNEVLENFWGPNKAAAWRKMFHDRNIHPAANGIPMSRLYDYLFRQAYFALKPLRETPEGVVVQWHWLTRSRLLPDIPCYDTYGTFRQAQLMERRSECCPGSGKAWQIRNGQTFLLCAGDSDSDNRPSWALLEMQWDFQRVVAICGAGDQHEGFGEYSARTRLYNPGARRRIGMLWVRWLGDRGIELSDLD